jgi:hypothetical protein
MSESKVNKENPSSTGNYEYRLTFQGGVEQMDFLFFKKPKIWSIVFEINLPVKVVLHERTKKLRSREENTTKIFQLIIFQK